MCWASGCYDFCSGESWQHECRNSRVSWSAICLKRGTAERPRIRPAPGKQDPRYDASTILLSTLVHYLRTQSVTHTHTHTHKVCYYVSITVIIVLNDIVAGFFNFLKNLFFVKWCVSSEILQSNAPDASMLQYVMHLLAAEDLEGLPPGGGIYAK